MNYRHTPDHGLCIHDATARRLPATTDKYITETEPLLCNCRAFRLVGFSKCGHGRHLGIVKLLPGRVSRRADGFELPRRGSLDAPGRRS